MLIAHLNINYLGNDSERLSEQVKEMVDVLIILETKFEDSLHVGQLKIPRYAFGWTKTNLVEASLSL